MSQTIRLSLPFPPSLWALYEGTGFSQRKSKVYRTWIAEAGWMLITQRNLGGRHKRINGDIAVEISAYPPAKKRPDLDNIIKAVLDLLTSTQTIADDNQVVDIWAHWTDEGVPCEVTIKCVADAPMQLEVA